MSTDRNIRLRDQRVPGWYWSQNELIDQVAHRVGVYGIAVYHVLARHSRHDEVSGMSAERIAAILDCSRAQVFRALAALETSGALMRRSAPGTGTTYFLSDLKSKPRPSVSSDGYAADNPSQSAPGGGSDRARTRLSQRLSNKEAKLQDWKTALPPTPLSGGESSTLLRGLDERAWSLVLERLKTECASTAVSTRLCDEYDSFFRDSWQIGLAQPNVIIVDAREPGLTEQGIFRYKRRIVAIGRRLFGKEISIQVGGIADQDFDRDGTGLELVSRRSGQEDSDPGGAGVRAIEKEMSQER